MLPPRRAPPVRDPSSPFCPGCADSLCDHDDDCNVIGGPASRFTLALDITIVLCTNPPGSNMFPCALAREKPEARPRKQKSKLNSLLHALRNALDMALDVGGYAFTGWPMWWLENVVLEFSARPDGRSVCDALADGALPAFRYHQRTRSESLRLLQTSPCDFSHFGSHLPSEAECFAHKLPQILEFVWPTALVIKYTGRVLAVCSEDGILWIADTGCGYHLVPEGDVKRGRAVVVPNPGAQRLHTANGEIDGSEL